MLQNFSRSIDSFIVRRKAVGCAIGILQGSLRLTAELVGRRLAGPLRNALRALGILDWGTGKPERTGTAPPASRGGRNAELAAVLEIPLIPGKRDVTPKLEVGNLPGCVESGGTAAVAEAGLVVPTFLGAPADTALIFVEAADAMGGSCAPGGGRCKPLTTVRAFCIVGTGGFPSRCSSRGIGADRLAGIRSARDALLAGSSMVELADEDADEAVDAKDAKLPRSCIFQAFLVIRRAGTVAADVGSGVDSTVREDEGSVMLIGSSSVLPMRVGTGASEQGSQSSSTRTQGTKIARFTSGRRWRRRDALTAHCRWR